MKQAVLLCILVFSLQIYSQVGPKSALTAGSESLIPGSQNKSITEPVPDQTHYSTPPKEAVIQQGTISSHPEPKSTSSKDIIMLFAGLLIATAIYFMFRKNPSANSPETAHIRLEDEREPELKKEVWKEIASDNIEDKK
jgi:hypothetical protein